MGDVPVDDEQPAVDWLREQEAEDRPAVFISAERRSGEGGRAGHRLAPVEDEAEPTVPDEPPPTRSDALPHQLDDPAGDAPSRAHSGDVNSGARRTVVWLGVGVLLMAVLIVLALLAFGGGSPTGQPPQHRVVAPSATGPSTSLVVPLRDQALPFTARTDSCTPTGGSSGQSGAQSPRALTDTGTDSAWVCGRGPQESLLDGQVLHVQLGCDPARPTAACSEVLTAVSVTPGWVAKTPAGKEEWLQHRVVTRLQFNFFNGDQLAADPFFLDTHNVHGPVSATLPAKVLTSRVDVVILHTERPPATPLTTSAAADPAALPGPDVADPPGASTDPMAGGSDPVDATFAISQLQFFGHPPN